MKALIATMASLIWKDHCNLIFNAKPPNLANILPCELSLCSDFFKASGHISREFSNHIKFQNSIIVYTDASWQISTNEAGLGFIIIANSCNILLAGCSRTKMDSSLKAELAAVNFALQIYGKHSWCPDKLLCDCPGVAQLLKNYTPCIAWSIDEEHQ